MGKISLTREIGGRSSRPRWRVLASSLRRADSHPRAQMLKGDSSVRQPLTRENESKKKRCKKSMSSRNTGRQSDMDATTETCGGTANQGAQYPTDLIVARLPRVAEALTLLPRAHCGVLMVSWALLGRWYPRPYQNGFPVSFSSTSLPQAPIHPMFKGPCPES
ncbi:uncharacterized protein K444DRAFT_405961 [Hyaloscypha bicolor E]|uniref:Uncharacterized protein n=1 Tax=Hyaloscypha bicolor E TaxID=1095630 RepID=A0A2J6T9C3_9HELO|nr:uncharacterized protein K444DRAFT_405961 [Hyaloscypha bicolor E]PMD59553.1 hypothetical protein K444DRAFT_405961 [Hyaloscypha bicolor E]